MYVRTNKDNCAVLCCVLLLCVVAGLFPHTGYTWDGVVHKMSDKQWDAMLDVHVTGMQALLPCVFPERFECGLNAASSSSEKPDCSCSPAWLLTWLTFGRQVDNYSQASLMMMIRAWMHSVLRVLLPVDLVAYPRPSPTTGPPPNTYVSAPASAPAPAAHTLFLSAIQAHPCAGPSVEGCSKGRAGGKRHCLTPRHHQHQQHVRHTRQRRAGVRH